MASGKPVHAPSTPTQVRGKKKEKKKKKKKKKKKTKKIPFSFRLVHLLLRRLRPRRFLLLSPLHRALRLLLLPHLLFPERRLKPLVETI
jgi:hypothetical protein